MVAAMEVKAPPEGFITISLVTGIESNPQLSAPPSQPVGQPVPQRLSPVSLSRDRRIGRLRNRRLRSQKILKVLDPAAVRHGSAQILVGVVFRINTMIADEI